MIKVSVIVPVYNSEYTISSCIKSILNQSYTDFELIIVDDGSTDESGRIIDDYIDKDNRIIVIHQENKGRTEARWVGVQKATGKWICFVDSDDTLPIDSLDNLVKGIDDNTDIVLGNGYTLPSESRNVIPISDFRHMAVRADGNIGLPWGSLYRREIVTSYLFDIPRHIVMGEDYIFWLRLVFSTDKPVSIVYEKVYEKGDDHTSNCFYWTADYCYELNELRKSAIPPEKKDEYLCDMVDDRIANLFAVATYEPRKNWKQSAFYLDIINDLQKLKRKLSFKQRLFLMLPHIKINIGWLLFLFIAALGMLGLQLLDAPTLSDDIVYRFVWQADESAPAHIINNISDVINSQLVHYRIINGRLVVHSLAQIFLSFSPYIYQSLNAILFALMLYLSSRLMVERQYRLFSIVFSCFLIFVLLADIRTTLLWGLGTFNYLWVTVLTLAFLLYLLNIKQSKNYIHCFLSPIALLVGCSHEAISLPLSITLLVYIFFNYKKEKFYPRFLYILLYVAGTVICLLSPGISGRADGDITLFNRIISGVINIVFNLKITWILVITLLILARKNKSYLKEKIYQRRYYYLCFLLSLGIVFLCGTNLERVVFYTDFIAMLLLMEIWAEKLTSLWQKRVIIASCVIMLIYYVPAMIVRNENYNNYQNMEEQMKEPGKEIISVRYPIKGEQPVMDYFRNRFVNPFTDFGYYCSYMGFNAKDINMRYAAALYGKKQMVFLPEDVVQRIESDSTAYYNYELDNHQSLYIWQLSEDKTVNKIVFELKPEDLSLLWPHQRLLAYKDDTFELDDNFHYSVVHINGRSYLIFTRPTTNIYRRINNIRYL